MHNNDDRVFRICYLRSGFIDSKSNTCKVQNGPTFWPPRAGRAPGAGGGTSRGSGSPEQSVALRAPDWIGHESCTLRPSKIEIRQYFGGQKSVVLWVLIVFLVIKGQYLPEKFRPRQTHTWRTYSTCWTHFTRSRYPIGRNLFNWEMSITIFELNGRREENSTPVFQDGQKCFL